MQPLATVGLLFLSALVASAICFAIDRQLHLMLKQHWKLILTALVMVFLWRVPADNQFFHGLEYEDSYVYTVAGRQIAEHLGPTVPSVSTPYSPEVCTVGSLVSCEHWEPVPEHLIGYPYLISLLAKIIGYTPSVGTFINLAAAGLSCVLIFCIAHLITESRFAATAAAAVFAMTPVFSVYGLETSAEPLLNVCLTLALWLYLRWVTLVASTTGWSRSLFWAAWTLVALYSQTVKREGLLISVIFLVVLPWIFGSFKVPRHRMYEVSCLLLISVALAGGLSLTMHLFQTTIHESELLDAFPLNVTRLTILVYSFLRSFGVYRWYAGTGVSVLIGMILCCRRKSLASVPLALFAAFIVLYALHIRSFYEMRSPSLDPQTALRFSMTLMGLWAILAGLGLWALGRTIVGFRLFLAYRKPITITVCCIIVGLCIRSFKQTVALRDESKEDEDLVRLRPAEDAEEMASRAPAKPDYVVTLEPLIIQMYSPATEKIIDLETVTATTVPQLLAGDDSVGIIYLEEQINQTDADEARYKLQTQFIDTLPRKLLEQTESFRVFRLGHPESGLYHLPKLP
jgi:hypothetical protein